MTLEKLLNILCEKGWEPRGIDQKFEVFIECLPYKKIRVCVKKPDYDYDVYSYRELVSKESGLRQFCCDKGFVEMYEGWYRQNIFPLDSKEYDYTDYQYWILESSLIDENKLEKFLLDNIKI